MAVEYTIKITLTDEQDAALAEIFAASGKTVQQVLDEMFTGYQGETQWQVGPVMAQINQWLADAVKTRLAGMDTAAALNHLSAIQAAAALKK
jgi:hypothetical protein